MVTKTDSGRSCFTPVFNDFCVTLLRRCSTSTIPHCQVGVFQSSNVTRAVGEQGPAHLAVETGAEPAQRLEAARFLHGFPDIVFGRVRDPILEPDAGQEADAGTGDVRLAGESENRNPHPEAFASSGRSMVGVRIERNVRLSEDLEMLANRDAANEFQPARGDAVRAE